MVRDMVRGLFDNENNRTQVPFTLCFYVYHYSDLIVIIIQGSFISSSQGWITAGNIAPIFPSPSQYQIPISYHHHIGQI